STLLPYTTLFRSAAHVLILLRNGGVAPIIVSMLVGEPLAHPRLRAVETLEPHLPPPLTDHLRIGGPSAHREDGAVLPDVVRQEAPTLVVEIVAVAIVGERGDDDRPETLRAPRGDLERGETAPRDPHHAGPPGTPRLVGDPFEHVLGVLLLLLQILVHESAVGIAASAQVHADARVAVARDVRVVDGVADCREVALPVGDVFHDRRYRLLGGRPPDPGGKFRTVRERDP